MKTEKCCYLEYWEGKGAEKNYSTPFQIEVFGRYVDRTADILDVGCGYGRVMRELLGNGYAKVQGVEPSVSLRDRGAAGDGSLSIAALENGRIPFPDNSFDAVLLIAVLTCIPQDGEQDALLAEIHRVLRPGGIIYINDFLLNTDQRNLDRYAEYESVHGCYGIFELEGGGVLRHFSDERMTGMLSPFKTEEYEKVIYTTMNGNKSNGFYYIGRK
ncbi:class I SAM-dependent methyltransferase [Maridesulfovibrio sp. FT414]|uniref:class I SAM-dependent methyltransferase n=1 Tax=Maridesulfovibrio sp. FT414 TaxID=2979469 RepID=UPI003D807149